MKLQKLGWTVCLFLSKFHSAIICKFRRKFEVITRIAIRKTAIIIRFRNKVEVVIEI